MHIVRGSAVEGGAGLPSTFIQQIFPIAVKKILESSDSAVLQVSLSIHIIACGLILHVFRMVESASEHLYLYQWDSWLHGESLCFVPCTATICFQE